MKIKYFNYWNLIIAISFITASFLFFNIRFIDGSKDLTWLVYLFVFLFLPLASGVVISNFVEKHFMTEYPEIQKSKKEFETILSRLILQQVDEGNGTIIKGDFFLQVERLKDSYYHLFKEQDKSEKFAKIYSRMLSIYYLGILALIFLLSILVS